MFEDNRPPPEPPSGQDDGPPDLRMTLLVAATLLADIDKRLAEEPTAEDLRLRIFAVTSVLRRVRQRLEVESDDG